MPFPSPGDLPDSGIRPRSPALWVDSLPTEPPGKAAPSIAVSKHLKSLKSESEVAQSCPTLCDPIDCCKGQSMDCLSIGSSVHRVFQARILGWVAIFFLQGIFPAQGSNPGLPHCRVKPLPSEPPNLERTPKNVIHISGSQRKRVAATTTVTQHPETEE